MQPKVVHVATHPLKRRSRPRFEIGGTRVSLVDLFAGCGGLTLGVAQAAAQRGLAIDVRLAVDFEEAPLRVLEQNFPTAKTNVAAVESFFDGDLGRAWTKVERQTKAATGPVDLLVGGPPCQGHSNLNNHTRRADPKNRLYLRMARAAEVLQPTVVMIENVPAVLHDSEQVVTAASSHLRGLGYVVADNVVELVRVGVAQRRKRHILVAVRRDALTDESDVGSVLRLPPTRLRTLRWAIGDLAGRAGTSWVDQPSNPSAQNRSRMEWLLANNIHDLPNVLRPPCHQGDHSYVSMYGRLRWDEPAQTITSGFGSMGQGRFMHPAEARTLTPHEAARLQGFPDYFAFVGAATRTELATIIGNAVPPQLAEALIGRLIDNGVLGN